MDTRSQSNSSAFPSSPYAAELQRGDAIGRFTAHLEAEYVRSHLAGSSTLIRLACALAALYAARHVADQALSGPWNTGHLALAILILAASIGLAAIAWSRGLERLYLPVARIVVPARNCVAAITVAATAAEGQLEAMMILPLMVLGPFFFLGLPYGVALLSVALTMASFAVSAMAFELPLPVILRASLLLIMATVACTLAARHLEKSSRRSFLERGLIAELAEHDPLTGLKNRRVVDEQMDQLWQQAIVHGRTIAILLIDVDHFKAYNDLYGHQAGDQTLRRVAQILQTFVSRPVDLLVRYGGEEFAAVLYNIDGREAEALAERMRGAVGELAIEHRGSRRYARVTISVGVAVIDPSRERRSRGALQLADQALYEAKMRGRNRVELKDQAAHGMLVTGVFAKGSLAQER